MADFTLEELLAEKSRRQAVATSALPDYSLNELLAEKARREQSSSEWTPGGSLKNFASGAVEGVTGMVGLGADLLSAFTPGPRLKIDDAGSVSVANPLDFEISKQIDEAVSPYLADKSPQYRYSRTVGQFVGPGGAIGAGGRLLKALGMAGPAIEGALSVAAPAAIASDATAGLGAQLAEDATGDKAIAPIVGAVVGGAAPKVIGGAVKGVGALLREPTIGEIRGSAADVIRDYTKLTPEEIRAARLSSGVDDLSSFKSTAELTDNAAIAQLEQELASSGSNASKYAERAARRSEARDAVIDRMTTTAAANPEAVGVNLAEKAKSVQGEMLDEARSAWASFPRRAPIDVGEGQAIVQRVIDTRQAGTPYGGKVRELLGQFLNDKDGKIRTSGALQDIRSSTLDLLRDANLSGAETHVLSEMRKAIDSSLESGLRGKDYQAWRKAADLTSAERTQFGRSSAGGRIINPETRPSNLVKNAFLGDEKSAREIKAAVRNDPAILDDVKRVVLDNIPRDTQGRLTSAKLSRFISANRNGIENLFGADKAVKLDRLVEDLRSADRVAELATFASKRGSATAQRLTTGGAIKEAVLNAMLPGGGGVVGRVAEEAQKAKAVRTVARINEVIFEAALDPRFAEDLLSAPTAEKVLTVAERLGLTLKNAAKAGARGGVLELSRTEIGGSATTGAQLLPAAPAPTAQQPVPNTPNRTGASPTPQRSESLPRESGGSGPYNNGRPTPVRKQDVKTLISEQPPLIQAVIRAESAGNPRAVSRAGAKGLMQLMPENVKTFGVSDPFDPAQSIEAGTRLLREEFKRFENPLLALAAYNAGSPRVLKAIRVAGSRQWVDVAKHLPKETRDYVAKVRRNYSELVRA